MFYQNNNDYMGDAFYYSIPQNSTYHNGYANNLTPIMQNSGIPMNNCMMANQMMNPMIQNQQSTPISTLYPQIYRIINPVANRVIASSNYQFLTEDTLNNMVDTVYNIVEGDVATLSNTIPPNTSDDTVTQGPTTIRGTTSNITANTTTSSNGTRQTNSENTRTVAVVATQNNRGSNELLRDLIKIIIIKEILTRQRNINTSNGFYNQLNNTGFSGNSNNFFDSRMGLI